MWITMWIIKIVDNFVDNFKELSEELSTSKSYPHHLSTENRPSYPHMWITFSAKPLLLQRFLKIVHIFCALLIIITYIYNIK